MNEPTQPDDEDRPEAISRIAPNEIEIRWSSGPALRYTARGLREICPCATCRERRRGDAAQAAPAASGKSLSMPILSAAEARPLTIDAVRPVGNYAYNITFGDGHQSGIFTLGLLREAGSPAG